MGVDIESGSPSSRPLYSVMVVDSSGRVYYKSENTPLPRLVRLVWDLKPSVVALDNVFELADSEKRLLKIFSLLPPETRVVQVTLSPDGLKSLTQIAREAGVLEEPGRLTPSKTAFLLAVLSCRGYGSDVRVVEERTVVHVSGRKPGSRGGWSQQRYQRRVRAAVYNAAEVVREALEKAGLDYDYSYRESRGGLESAVFTVYAPVSRVAEVVPKLDSSSVTVKVKPVVKSKLAIPRSPRFSERLLIVGVDPGVTVGLAVLDASSGDVLYVGSGKNMDRGSIIDIVLSYGKPAIVAADVAEPPEAVRKLAAQLGATLYTPPQDLSVIEKHELVASYGFAASNSHERDALAAAIKAYRVVKSRIRKVEEVASRLSLDLDLSDVKREILRGVALADALERVIERVLEEPREESTRVEQEAKHEKCEVDVSHYVVKIEELRERNRVLEAQVAALEEKVRELESRLRIQQQAVKAELLRDSELESLKSRLRELEKELEKHKARLEEEEAEKTRLEEALVRLSRGEIAIALVLPSVTANSVKEAAGFKLVAVKNPGTFEEQAVKAAAEAGVECFILREEDLDSPLARALARLGVPVVKREEVELAELKNLLLVTREALAKCTEERRRLSEERKKHSLTVEKIVEEYRRLLAREQSTKR